MMILCQLKAEFFIQLRPKGKTADIDAEFPRMRGTAS
jgi:hypothetical protein